MASACPLALHFHLREILLNLRKGAAIYLGGTSILKLTISASIFADCCANSAAVIHANSGGVLLSNGTLFRNITGAAIFVGAADVVYQLPAPAGRYLPSASVRGVCACWR